MQLKKWRKNYNKMKEMNTFRKKIYINNPIDMK